MSRSVGGALVSVGVAPRGRVARDRVDLRNRLSVEWPRVRLVRQRRDRARRRGRRRERHSRKPRGMSDGRVIGLWLWLLASLIGSAVVSTVGARSRRSRRVSDTPRPARGVVPFRPGGIRRYGDPNSSAGAAPRSPRRRPRCRGRGVRGPFGRCDRGALSPASARPYPASPRVTSALGGAGTSR